MFYFFFSVRESFLTDTDAIASKLLQDEMRHSLNNSLSVNSA